jgi:excinuclease ABC subunit A
MKTTRLRGARTHNLRSVDLDLEPGSLVVLAGPSGAGKSSLAFGTLYAEGQRRYVESFSAYARQFLERLARPPVDSLDPVPAAIAVDRQAPVRTSRSTVGTMTEVTDYAKSLWARAATLHCPSCDRPVRPDDPETAAEAVLASALEGAKLLVTYPAPVPTPDDFVGVRETLVGLGYRRVLVGESASILDLDEVRPSDLFGEAAPKRRRGHAPARIARSASKTTKKTKKKRRPSRRRPVEPRDGGAPARAPAPPPAFEVVADRLVARASDRGRLVESVEAALRHGAGRAAVRVVDGAVHRFSTGLTCAHCERSFRRATPGLFTFNSPVGACPTCRGFGRTIGVDVDKVIPDPSLSLRDGAVRAFRGRAAMWERRELLKHAKKAGIPTDVPVASLDAAQRAWIIEGDELGYPKGWWGIRGWFRWMESRAYKMHVRVFLSRYRKYETCAACEGARLTPEALWFRLGDLRLPDLYALPVSEALAFVRGLHGSRRDPTTSLLVSEVESRLTMLVDVGLGYLTLDRASRSLSGGETQRVALTSALGASLTGAMFVLDEPTVGLHPRDVDKLEAVVRGLVHADNVALVVEHDETMIRAADRVVELGPGAGERGGTIVFDGTPSALSRANTATGRALRQRAETFQRRRTGTGVIRLEGATGNNLADVDVEIPRGALTCVTGVSGSGKSSLILETLFPAVARAFEREGRAALPHRSISGHESLSGVVRVDQSPLGRTSRGNPATYLKIWDAIRKRFTGEPLARDRGYTPGTFSFNVAGGRCEACRGEGAETVEMQFLADVTFACPECGGRRFVGEVLEVLHRGMSVADVLELTASEAKVRFEGDAKIEEGLCPLEDVGLGYIRLGQPLNTLSGGEAQRLKLAEALSNATAGSLVLLDEPTAGLHPDDVAPLLEVFTRLVERGDTVVVVEHDMRVAAQATRGVESSPEVRRRKWRDKEARRLPLSSRGSSVSRPTRPRRPSRPRGSGRRSAPITASMGSPSSAPRSTTSAGSTWRSHESNWSSSPGRAAAASPPSRSTWCTQKGSAAISRH